MEAILILVVLAIIFWWCRSLFLPTPSRWWREAVQRVAQQYSGVVDRDGQNFDAAYFTYHGQQSADVVVRRRYWNGATTTELLASWPPDWTCAISISPTYLQNVAPIPHGLIVDTSRDQVLWRYRVVTNDRSTATRLLNDAVKWQLESLRQYLPSAPFEVRIENQRFSVRKQHPLENPEQLERFVALALRCWDHFQSALVYDDQQDILVTSVTQSPLARCPICRDQIPSDSGQTIACPQCGTIHHQECWKYNQGCGAYGCGGSSG